MATTAPPATPPVADSVGTAPPGVALPGNGRPGPAAGIPACCTPLAREPLSAQEAERLAAVLRAVAVPTRLRLLSMIYAREGGEACVCELTEPLGLTQPTVSHHLKVLVDAGLVTRDKRGVWAYYRAVPEALAAIGAVFGSP